MSARLRRSVIATSRPCSSSPSALERQAGVDALGEQRSTTPSTVRGRRARAAARTRARPAASAAARRRLSRPAPRARSASAAAAVRRARRCPRGRATTGRPRRRARSAPAPCRCSTSPSRGGCAARASAASARSRGVPSASTVSPAIRPGIRRRCSSVAAKKPNDGPPKSSRLPSVWPSPTQTSTPHSPGGARIPSGIGSYAAIATTPSACRLATAVSAAMSSTAPSTFGCCRKTAADVVADRRRPGVGIGDAVDKPDLDDLGAEAGGVGAQRLERVRVQPGRGNEARAAVGEPCEIAGAREALGPRRPRRWRPAARSAR